MTMSIHCFASHGVKPIRGSLAGMLSCRITYTCFVRLQCLNRYRFSSGFRIGNPMPRAIGQSRKTRQSGSAISGIPS